MKLGDRVTVTFTHPKDGEFVNAPGVIVKHHNSATQAQVMLDRFANHFEVLLDAENTSRVFPVGFPGLHLYRPIVDMLAEVADG